jgi:O-antigen/teichoic acid export membrane protein
MNSNVEISKRLVLVNSAASVGTMLLNAAVAIWLQQYLLRRVNSDEFSLIPVLSAAMMFLPLLTTVLTSGIGRYVVESYAKGDEKRVTQIVSTMFPVLFAASVLVLVLGYFSVRYIDSILKIAPEQISNARIMLSIMMFSFAIRLFLAPFSIGLYVKQKFVLQNIINFGSELFRIGLLFVLLFFISTSVVWVIVASTLSNLTGFFIIIIISLRQISSLRFYMREFRWHLVRKLVSFGGWTAVGNLGGSIRSVADPLILNRFATPVDVTVFYLGSLADRQIRQVMSVLIGPLQPQLIAMHAMERKDRLSNAFLRLGRLSIWALFFVIGPLLIFRQELFQLYLQEKYLTYSSAATIMVLLLSYLPISYSLYGLDQIAMATAKIKVYMIITVSSQIINLILTFYFVGFLHMGAIGSALATFLVGIGVTLFAYFPLSLSLAEIKIGNFLKKILFPGLLPGIFGTGTWMVLRIIVHPDNWLSLAACVFSGMIVYLLVLFLWCLQPMDQSDIRSILKVIKLRLHKNDD